MKKILYLHQYYCPNNGWGNNRSNELARYWTERGRQVTVLTTTAYFPPNHPAHSQGVYRFQENSVQVVCLRVPYQQEMGYAGRIAAFLAFFFRAFFTALRLPKPDLIYASSTPLTVGELGRWLSVVWRRPLVFEAVDVWPDVPIGMGVVRNSLLIRLLNVLTNQIYRHARAIVTLSEGMKEQILQHGVPPEKVFVAHNGTNVEQFFPLPKNTTNEICAVYAGAVGTANGVSALILAAAALQAEGAPLRFEIYGWGNEWEAVQRLAQEKGCRNLHFYPPAPKADLNGIFARAHFGVATFAPFPVLEANSANKFFDYLAAGLPVVCNYRGWQAGYLEKYNCGLTSPQNDLNAFVANIKQMTLDADFRTEAAAQARKLAQEKFDRRRIADDLLQVFDRLETK